MLHSAKFFRVLSSAWKDDRNVRCRRTGPGWGNPRRSARNVPTVALIHPSTSCGGLGATLHRMLRFASLLLAGAVLLSACSASKPTDTPRMSPDQVAAIIRQSESAALHCSGNTVYQGHGVWACENLFYFDEVTGRVWLQRGSPTP